MAHGKPILYVCKHCNKYAKFPRFYFNEVKCECGRKAIQNIDQYNLNKDIEFEKWYKI